MKRALQFRQLLTESLERRQLFAADLAFQNDRSFVDAHDSAFGVSLSAEFSDRQWQSREVNATSRWDSPSLARGSFAGDRDRDRRESASDDGSFGPSHRYDESPKRSNWNGEIRSGFEGARLDRTNTLHFSHLSPAPLKPSSLDSEIAPTVKLSTSGLQAVSQLQFTQPVIVIVRVSLNSNLLSQSNRNAVPSLPLGSDFASSASRADFAEFQPVVSLTQGNSTRYLTSTKVLGASQESSKSTMNSVSAQQYAIEFRTPGAQPSLAHFSDSQDRFSVSIDTYDRYIAKQKEESLIEIFGLRPESTTLDALGDSSESWTLSEQTLQSLKKFARSGDNSRPSPTDPNATDTTSGLNRDGDLIAIAARRDPIQRTYPSVDAVQISMRLESTLGMHRVIEMMHNGSYVQVSGADDDLATFDAMSADRALKEITDSDLSGLIGNKAEVATESETGNRRSFYYSLFCTTALAAFSGQLLKSRRRKRVGQRRD